MTEIQAGPVVKVARDLRAIEDLYEAVLVQAINKANDRLMPGGEAMVALGHAASPRGWAENLEAAEFGHLTACEKLDHTRCRYAEHVGDEGDGEPILQTLLFWSEAWRDYDMERRPTVRTEANFIRGRLDWAWENLPEWDDFAEDIKDAKSRLENLLYAGSRPAFRGSPCMYDRKTLVRITKPVRDKVTGEKKWVLTDWFCRTCRRSWTEEEYARNQAGALESLHYRHVGEEAYCTVERAAKRIGRSPATVWSWINRNQVRAVCTLEDRRTLVHMADLHARHQLAIERANRMKAARMSA